jgi:hypothetical protein
MYVDDAAILVSPIIQDVTNLVSTLPDFGHYLGALCMVINDKGIFSGLNQKLGVQKIGVHLA